MEEAEGEELRGCGREGAAASLCMEGQRSARGYRVLCKEEGVEPLCHQTEMKMMMMKTGRELEELRRQINTTDECS